MNKPCNIDWSTVDWSLGTKPLARKLGVSAPTVRKYRAMRGTNHTPIPPGRKPKYDWASVDWTKTDYAIARQLGCSTMTAYYNRMKFKLKTREFYSRIKPKAAQTKSITVDVAPGEVAKMLDEQKDLMLKAAERDFLAQCLEESLRLFATPSAYPKDNPALFSEMAACEVRARHAIRK